MIVTGAVAMFSAPAFGVSPSEQACLDAGGTFTRTQGVVSCVIADPGKNPKFSQDTTTTGQGNISNKQQTSTACDRPGATEKCPPGQF